MMTESETKLMAGVEVLCCSIRAQVLALCALCPDRKVEIMSALMGTGIGFCEGFGIDPVKLAIVLLEIHNQTKDKGAPKPLLGE